MEVRVIYDLHALCLEGSLEEIKIRILPRNINSVDSRGRTPLMCAVLASHIHVVKYLISQKALINTQDHQGWSALMMASYQNDREMVKLLIAHNASLHLKNKDSMTALQLALLKGHKDLSQLLSQNKEFKFSDQMQSWMHYLIRSRKSKNH